MNDFHLGNNQSEVKRVISAVDNQRRNTSCVKCIQETLSLLWMRYDIYTWRYFRNTSHACSEIWKKNNKMLFKMYRNVGICMNCFLWISIWYPSPQATIYSTSLLKLVSRKVRSIFWFVFKFFILVYFYYALNWFRDCLIKVLWI